MLVYIVTQSTRSEMNAIDPSLDGRDIILLKDEMILLQKMKDGSLRDVAIYPMEARDDARSLAEGEMANHVDGSVVIKVDGNLYRGTLPEPLVIRGHRSVAAPFSRVMLPFEITFGTVDATR